MEGEIIFNIDVMLAKRKMSVSELADRVGITLANMSILKTGKAKAVKVSWTASRETCLSTGSPLITNKRIVNIHCRGSASLVVFLSGFHHKIFLFALQFGSAHDKILSERSASLILSVKENNHERNHQERHQ